MRYKSLIQSFLWYIFTGVFLLSFSLPQMSHEKAFYFMAALLAHLACIAWLYLEVVELLTKPKPQLALEKTPMTFILSNGKKLKIQIEGSEEF